jgi:hypothetical protein
MKNRNITDENVIFGKGAKEIQPHINTDFWNKIN